MTAALFITPLWIDITAVAIGALQGALTAAQFRSRKLDLLGVAIIGIATGFGGGLLRDILLVEVPATLQSNWYLPVAAAAAMVGMLLERVFTRLNATITILDALTIGLFGAIGTTKALAWGLPEVPAIFVGVVSAVGGSILRDILLNLPIALMHVGSLYAVAALLGSSTLVVMMAFGAPIFVSAVVCVAVTFSVRVLAVFFNWSLPEQRRLERLPRIPRMPQIPRLPHLTRLSRNPRTPRPSRGSVPPVPRTLRRRP
ncbi:MAG TPA: TRIC cation channel family protein [Glaciihabitans sp.]|nr:TRIC cation channel family protein [Glaciihabitans sp.]